MLHIIISAKIVKKNKKEHNKSINIRVKLSFIVKTYLSNFQSRINHVEPISMESAIAFGIGRRVVKENRLALVGPYKLVALCSF